MNLFEIDREIKDCRKPVIDQETGEIVGWEVDLEKLEALEMDRMTKIRNIACWVKNLDADEKALDAQEKIFAERKKAVKNKKESLKDYLKAYLDGKAEKGAEFAISFRATKSTDIIDEKAIPPEYLVPVAPRIDKAGILKDLKAGAEIPGAQLKISQSMTIK